MDPQLLEIFKTVFTVASGGIAAYVAIRADLSNHSARIDLVEKSAERAHVRIDDHISRHE